MIIALGGEHFGWRLTFLVNVPVGTAAFLLASRMLPRDRPVPRPRPLHLPGAALLTVGLGGVLFPIVEYDADRDASRLALIVPTFIGVTLLGFLLIHSIPGDPVEVRVGERGISPERLAYFRHELGLDQPLWKQFLDYQGQLLHGDLGRTVRGQQPVAEVLLQRLPNTLALAFAAMAVAAVLGVALAVVVVTARGEVGDRTRGLALGADDYVAKPFDRRELVARIRAVLRRAAGSAAPVAGRGRRVRFAGWTLDMGRRELLSPRGATVDLSGAEYDLLTVFLDNPQRTLSRERLLELARNRVSITATDRSVDVQVSRLRQKLEPDEGTWSIIKTVRGVGYVFAADVEPA